MKEIPLCGWTLKGFTTLALLMALSAAGAETPQPRAAVPPDGKIVLREYGCRDWGPELVHYRLDTERFKPGKLQLADAAGKLVPFQVEGNTLSFVASVGQGQTAGYTLSAAEADRGAENFSLRSSETNEALEVANEFLSLRMPKPGGKAFAPSIEAAQAPCPITQWKPVGFDAWIGGARFVSPRQISACRFSLVHQGPAFVEYEARYVFAPKGEYVWRIRLAAGMPIAIISEEFDLGEITEGQDLLLFELHKGWPPQHVGWIGQQPEGQNLPPFYSKPFAQYVEEKKKARAQPAPVGGTGQAPAPFVPEKDLILLDRSVPAGKWGGYVGGVQLWEGDASKPGTGRNLAFVTLSAGSWRRALALNAWYREGTGFSIGLPISMRRIRWSLDIADDFSPFSNHEHDPDLPDTYGRRVWGLCVGPEANAAQARFGYIGLDRYKDWVIELPDPPKEHLSPRPFFAPAAVEQIKSAMDQHPDAWMLRSWYLFSGKAEDAVRHAETVVNGLKKPYGENSFFVTGLTHYRQSQFRAFTLQAEDALACPELPAELRRELRRWLALYASLNTEPDFNPRGAGVHLGNNNMSFNRSFALTYFACLLPDHPAYAAWMDGLKRHLLFKIASQTAVDGPFIECPTYQLYSPARTLNVTLNALKNLGLIDAQTLNYHQATLWYLANLTMPDVRFDSRRIIPGMGNSGNRLENIFGLSMTTVGDPDFAGFLRAFHRLTKGRAVRPPDHKGFWAGTEDEEAYALFHLPNVPEKPRPLATTILPTYGVVFRSHFGTPNETAMLLRAGMNWSHWDTDSLNVILYGKGAPLSPGTGYQYLANPAPQENNGLYHNRIKVGQRDLQEVFGRVDDAIADYGFGENCDYAVADRFYPSQLFKDGKGTMHWRRHVLFLKSRDSAGPNYFVMRDTFPGGEGMPKWWNWLNLDTADLIAVDGQSFDKAQAPVNRAVPEAQMPSRRGQTVEMKTNHGASTWFWWPEPRDVRIRMTFDYPRQDGVGGTETKTIVEIPAGPNQDFHCVVFPRKDGEAVPQCQALAPGVVKVATAESTDFVFIGDQPFAWNRDGVVFTGKAGVVRIFKDQVVFALNAGSGRIGYKGNVFEGHGPFEQSVKLSELKRKVNKLDGGYPKEIVTVDLGRGVRVIGESPFTARLDGETIAINAEGRARVLHVTQPPFIVRPQCWVDGQEWMACWTDYPASGWGSYDNTWLIGLAVPDGEHELVVKNMTYPAPWPWQFDVLIGPTRDN